MALFGDEMTQVRTPDGRVITVPRQLASQFPGLAPVAPPDPQWTPQDTQTLAQLTPPPDASAAPVTTPAQVPPGGPPSKPVRVPVTAPQPDAGPPNPVTNAQLAKLGNAGVLEEQNRALDQRSAATQAVAKVDAETATKVGQESVRRDEEQQQLLAQRAAAAQEFQTSLDSKMAEYERNAKSIADVKIDRSADHPVMAGIFLALGSLGDAMQGKSQSSALQAFYQAIDRKVSGQIQDLDQKRASLGVQREAIGMARQAGQDRLATMDQYRIAALDQAMRKIETIKTTSSSDRVVANAQLLQADIAQQRATTLEQASTREAARLQHIADQKQLAQQHAQTIGVQIRGQNLEQKRFDLDRAEKARERDMLQAEKDAALKAKYGEQRAKDLRERGVWDPSTGDYLMTPDGQKKLAQADKLEAAARKADPELAQKQRAQAAKLRDSAQLNDSEMAPDTERARKVGDVLGASHSIYQKLAQMRSMLEGDPSTFDRETWAALTTNFGTVANEYANTVGERVSPRAMAAFEEHIANYDPDSLLSRATGKGKAIASLREIETAIKQNVDARLKANGIKNGWTPSSPRESSAEETFHGKTSQEVGADAEPGLVTKAAVGIQEAGKALLSPIDATSPDSLIGRRDPALEAENAAVGKSNYGLDPTVEAKTKALIAQADSAGDAKRKQIIDSLAQPIIRGDRPGLSGGITGVLRDTDPRLLAEVIARVGAENPELASQLVQFEQARAGLPGRNLPQGAR